MDWKQKYEALFEEICRAKYGMRIGFAAIEKSVAHLRQGDTIEYSDLETIAREDLWPFDKYWYWPSREQIEDVLKKTGGLIIDPIRQADDEPAMLGGLLGIFRNVALVSILLRFVWPEHYAIYSRGVLKMLQIERGGDDIEELLNLAQFMRVLRYSFGVERTADVDMIIWAISQKRGEFEAIKGLIADRLPEEIPLADLLKHASSEPLRMARAYFNLGDFQTCAFWTARAFEKILHRECIRKMGYLPHNDDRIVGDLEFLIQCVCGSKVNAELKVLKRLRNDAVHIEKTFNKEMASAFLDGVQKLEHSAGLIMPEREAS